MSETLYFASLLGVNPGQRRISVVGTLTIALLFVASACDDSEAEKKLAAGRAAEAKAIKDSEKLVGGLVAGLEEDGAHVTQDANGNIIAGFEVEKAKEDAEDGAEAAADAEIGVPVCDEYIEKYGACIKEHAPENAREAMAEALAKSAERFSMQSAGPEKDSLGQACKAMLDAAKKTTKDWGCTYE